MRLFGVRLAGFRLRQIVIVLQQRLILFLRHFESPFRTCNPWVGGYPDAIETQCQLGAARVSELASLC